MSWRCKVGLHKWGALRCVEGQHQKTCVRCHRVWHHDCNCVHYPGDVPPPPPPPSFESCCGLPDMSPEAMERCMALMPPVKPPKGSRASLLRLKMHNAMTDIALEATGMYGQGHEELDQRIDAANAIQGEIDLLDNTEGPEVTP